MLNVKKYKHFLNDNEYIDLINSFQSKDLNWQSNENTANPATSINTKLTKDSPQKVCLFLSRSKTPDFYILENICNKIKKLYNVEFIRIKANYVLKDQKSLGYHHYLHKDSDAEDFISFIYYVYDSDGDTVFFNDYVEEIFKCSPQKNMLIQFPSKILHASSSPVYYNSRLVINFVCKRL